MITKECKCCKKHKTLNEFFTSLLMGSSLGRTGMYCKSCHADGKIKHGYGWYGDKYQSPSSI